MSKITLDIIQEIAQPSPSKIILLVMDGLGGLPHPQTGKTELETARTPNLDRLAATGICGLTEPVAPGITPGSAPGHLSLFGYDPVKYTIGRGILEAVGIDFDVRRGDVAVRGNFCTIDEVGRVTDRRAGRLSDDRCVELCKLLDGQTINGVKIFVRPVREHRLVVVMRGEGLVPDVGDSDPQKTGVAPLMISAHSPAAEKLAKVANELLARAKKLLVKHHPANMVLLRGFSQHPDLPTISEIFKLKPAAIASYPMYRGLAKLVGMDVLKTGKTIEDEIQTLKQNYASYDFFFVHIKGTDTGGEDGNFEAKVHYIEEADGALPALEHLSPDVLVVTADHSTPSAMKGHSWHPVPVLLWSKTARRDGVREFNEVACLRGGLGLRPSMHLMPLALAHAGRLAKFGA